MKKMKSRTDKTDVRTLAWGGFLTALSAIFIFAAVAAPTANFALFALASLCTAVLVVRSGIKAAAVMVAATSFLTAFWPGFWLALPYICLFGPYPIVKALLEKAIKNQLPALAFKLASATVMSSLAILLTAGFAGLRLSEMFTLPFNLSLTGGFFWLAAVIVLEIVLLAYDYGLSLLITWYMKRLHNRF